MKLRLFILIGTIVTFCHSIEAQVNYCLDKNCTHCKIMRAVDYQFNSVRNDITLPDNIDGRQLQWELKNNEGGDTPYLSFDGTVLHIKSLPKGHTAEGGVLLCNAGYETLAFPLTIAADDEMYGYLYCHMAGNSENTLYALGTKDDRGVKFHPLLNNQPIYNAEEIAGIEGGVRDAFICRGKDNNYLMVTTDMSNRKSRSWFNHGINLLTSNDLVHWRSTTFDFRRGSEIFSDPESPNVVKDWSKINRVWAPQIIWDPDYNNGKGGYLVYYSMLSTNEGDNHDRIFYSYASRDFTSITKPQLFHDGGRAVIDCHIDWNDCDRQYHVFYKKEGAAGSERGIYEAVFDRLPSNEWRDICHITNEGKSNVEGPSAFRLINENRWKVAYINYGVNPRIYKVCEANATEEEIDKGMEIGTDVNPQHGSFMMVTKDEYDLLEAWSALKLKIQESENNPKKKNSRILKRAKEVLQDTYPDNAVQQLLLRYRHLLERL